MARKNPVLFPGWRLSPDGKEYKLFDRAEDVPEGWLRETPASFVKNGLDRAPAQHSPIRPVADEYKHVPADYESKPVKRGRPAKAKDDGALDL